MPAVEEGDIEIIDMWEEGDGDQDVTFVKRKLEKVLRELMVVAYIDGTFMKRGIGILPIYCEYIRYHI